MRFHHLGTLPVPEDMKHLINYDEKVIWVLRGSETVVVSDQRIIIRRTGGLGLKKSFVDYPYSNMVNIKLDRGVRRASVEILMRSGVQNIKVGNLAKPDAFQLHRILRENIVRDSGSGSGQPLPVIIQGPERPTHVADSSGEQLCKKCGRRVAADFALCPFCRYPFKVECPECGKNVDRTFKLCPYCGEDLSYVEQIDLEL
jgi:RNA polymerase subunit RPABC4/transcription elongation factor Spt4